MTIQELLRSMLDRLDKIENSKPSQSSAPVVVHVHNNTYSNGSKTPLTTDDTDNTGTFVPPLQQKIELAKRSAGLPSVFDDDHDDDDGPFEG